MVNECSEIVYGLGVIKGLGEGFIDVILEGCEVDKLYKNLFEFCCCVDLKKFNWRVMEVLICVGVLDKFGFDCVMLMVNLQEVICYVEQENNNQVIGIMDMFGFIDDELVLEFEWIKVKFWSDDECLNGEKDILGFYFIGYFID